MILPQTFRRRSQFICIATLVFHLTGCATSNDPRKGGFVSGIGGLSSGSYAERQRILETERDQALAHQGVLESQKSSLDREQQKLATAIAAKRRELAALQRRLVNLRASPAVQTGGRGQSYSQSINRLNRQATVTLQQPAGDHHEELADLTQTIAEMNRLVAEITATN